MSNDVLPFLTALEIPVPVFCALAIINGRFAGVLRASYTLSNAFTILSVPTASGIGFSRSIIRFRSSGT